MGRSPASRYQVPSDRGRADTPTMPLWGARVPVEPNARSCRTDAAGESLRRGFSMHDHGRAWAMSLEQRHSTTEWRSAPTWCTCFQRHNLNRSLCVCIQWVTKYSSRERELPADLGVPPLRGLDRCHRTATWMAGDRIAQFIRASRAWRPARIRPQRGVVLVDSPDLEQASHAKS